METKFIVIEWASALAVFFFSDLLSLIPVFQAKVPVLNFPGNISIPDPNINFEFIDPNKVLVPIWLLIVTSLFVPLFVLTILTATQHLFSSNSGKFQRRLAPLRSHDAEDPLLETNSQRGFDRSKWFSTLEPTALALVQSISLTRFLTDFIKRQTGRLRPNFIQLCQYNFTTGNCDAKEIWRHTEGRLSFPSGHSSLAFAGLLYLSLCMITFFNVGHARSFRLLRVIFCILPCLLATWVAITRVQDYWHNHSDILAGSILGAYIAVGVFYMNFGSPWGLSDRKRN